MNETVARKSPSIRFSVVVPVHNEAGNIAALDRELKQILPTLGGAYEIIYVDDASTDGTAAELESLNDVTVVTLQRRYGQATALLAGFDLARGELVISLDGDGQNDPADIPNLLAKLESDNLDVVTGWRHKRQDRHGIRLLTVIGRMFRRLLIADVVHDTGCTLRIYRAEAVKSLDIGGEMHRYILPLLRWNGFRIGEVPVNDRKRQNGVSKYGYGKAVRGSIDLVYVWFLYKYSQRPLHLFGYMSLISFALALFSAGFTIYDRVARHTHLNHDGWFFLTFFFSLGALLLFSFGIIIDLLIRIYLTVSPSQRTYYVRDVTYR